jgi:hypothetical protein
MLSRSGMRLLLFPIPSEFLILFQVCSYDVYKGYTINTSNIRQIHFLA